MRTEKLIQIAQKILTVKLQGLYQPAFLGTAWTSSNKIKSCHDTLESSGSQQELRRIVRHHTVLPDARRDPLVTKLLRAMSENHNKNTSFSFTSPNTQTHARASP